MQIIFASNNIYKLKEFTQILAPASIELIPQIKLQIPAVPETGATLRENALLKAHHAAHHSNLPIIAEDSGLEVTALAKRPGVYSARYAGPNATASANMRKLLQELAGIPAAQRTAYFRCVIVFIKSNKDSTPIICQGRWEGEITLRPQGNNGFGYDPIFWVPSHHCTAAQLPTKLKNTISHRARALQQLKQILCYENPYRS